MKPFPFSKIRSLVILLSLLILSGGTGYRLGEAGFFKDGTSGSGTRSVLINRETPADANVDFSLFWDVWQRLQRYYIDKEDLDTQTMVWGAIRGMVEAVGDPYTAFLPPKENKEFKEDLNGSFEGIGAQLGLRDGRVIVVSPLKGHPAESAGLMPGDYIVKVDGQETEGWSIEQAVSEIRGPKGTTVILTILHQDASESEDIPIVRDTILLPSVVSWVRDVSEIEEISGIDDPAVYALSSRGRIAYLELSRFGDRTNDEWNNSVNQIVAELSSGNPPQGVILDLRNNPGGYLQGSVYIASEFLKSGTVVSQKNSDGSTEHFSVRRRGKLLDVPVVVLINEGSASASEIVAGALRDYERATIVGQISFGKGTIQTPQDLPGGAGLHITTGKWLLPNGGTISDEGIAPDVIVPMDIRDATRDAQLAKAIELILQ